MGICKKSTLLVIGDRKDERVNFLSQQGASRHKNFIIDFKNYKEIKFSYRANRRKDEASF